MTKSDKKFNLVHIVGGGSSESELFQRNGFKVIPSFKEANLVVFTGGGDIDPGFYNESPLPRTGSSTRRDEFESDVFESLDKDQFKIGICRGAQLICALSGGSLWQDVNLHGGRDHSVDIVSTRFKAKWHDLKKKDTAIVNSLHHQMLRELPYGSEVLAQTKLATSKMAQNIHVVDSAGIGNDYEVVINPIDRLLMFQGHPEYHHKEAEELFFLSLVYLVERVEELRIAADEKHKKINDNSGES